MAKTIRQFVDGRYGQVHLRKTLPESTAFAPLICLHMFPQSGRNFQPLLEAASADRLIIAPDFPGYGESAPPPDPISAADYAASIWDVIDALDLIDAHGQVDLFGIHAGAKLAVEVARQRPDHVNRIVLSSAAILNAEELENLRSMFTPIPLDEDGTRFRTLWQILIANRGKGMSYEMMSRSLAEMLRGGEGYEWGHHAVFEYNKEFPEAIASLPHPIALLNPGDDLKEMTPRTASYIQNGELFEFPEWEQGFLEVNADDVWKVIAQILAKGAEQPSPAPIREAKV